MQQRCISNRSAKRALQGLEPTTAWAETPGFRWLSPKCEFNCSVSSVGANYTHGCDYMEETTKVHLLGVWTPNQTQLLNVSDVLQAQMKGY